MNYHPWSRETRIKWGREKFGWYGSFVVEEEVTCRFGDGAISDGSGEGAGGKFSIGSGQATLLCPTLPQAKKIILMPS